MKLKTSLKVHLVLQSFSPLFLLILVQHFKVDFFRAIYGFFYAIFFTRIGIWDVILKTFSYSLLGDFCISAICVSWLCFACVVWVGFNDFRTKGLTSLGEQIHVEEEISDAGASYFMTFVFPILVNDVNTLEGFLFFSSLLLLLILLVIKTSLFYQNPVLTLLRYKIIKFKFINPLEEGVLEDYVYIGIYQGKIPKSNMIIKRKRISDNVFIIDLNN